MKTKIKTPRKRINKDKIYKEEKIRHEARKQIKQQETKKGLKGCMVGCLSLIIVFILLVFVITISNKTKTGYNSNQNTRKKDSVIKVTEKQKQKVYDTIKTFDRVKDASIAQKDKTLSLVLIVNYGTNEKKAKELAESFMRITKLFSGDTPPDKTIGEGKFDYIIEVINPKNKKIVFGAKSSVAETIYWD